MAFKTMQQLVTRTEQLLYQSAGSAVQIYSETLLLNMLNDAFDIIFTEAWWPQFRAREVLVLDGVTGFPTVPLTRVTRYDDIRYVFPAHSRRPLSALPMGLSTLDGKINSGNYPKFIEGTGQTPNVFRVWPNTATGQIEVVGRGRVGPFALGDVVPMDEVLITHHAAWSYFVDDGSNPMSADKYRRLYEAALRGIKEDTFNEPIMLDPQVDAAPSQWTEGRFL